MLDLAPLVEIRDLLRQVVDALSVAPTRGLGPEDLLTEREVARYVRIQDREAGPWLTERKVPPFASPGGRRMLLYRVRDVQLALRSDRATAATTSARARLAGS